MLFSLTSKGLPIAQNYKRLHLPCQDSLVPALCKANERCVQIALTPGNVCASAASLARQEDVCEPCLQHVDI